MNIHKATKERILEDIEKSGCKMLQDKLDGSETKDEIIEYLYECRCPKIHSLYSGLEPYPETE
jgi:hypothetical protein